MKRSFLLSLVGVAVLALGVAACTAVGSAHALSYLPDIHAAASASADPDTLAVTMATLAAGVTASPSLQATEDYSAKGATAPRVTLDSMKAKILGEHFFTAGAAVTALDQPGHPSLDLLTVCILVMDNGFSVIGKSASASPANFDPDKGRTFAYEDAIRQLWPLEGYALRERLSAEAA